MTTPAATVATLDTPTAEARPGEDWRRGAPVALTPWTRGPVVTTVDIPVTRLPDGLQQISADDRADASTDMRVGVAPYDPAHPTPAQVRRWARTEGLDVPDRGRLPRHVWDAYRAAHPRHGQTIDGYWSPRCRAGMLGCDDLACVCDCHDTDQGAESA
jgi:hypothetical protein